MALNECRHDIARDDIENDNSHHTGVDPQERHADMAEKDQDGQYESKNAGILTC